MSIFGAIIGAIAAPLIGGLIGGSSARSTNSSNERIAQQETEVNLASAREANALTEKLSGKAIKSTEKMTASAIALSKSQFDQSQAFNERMSNTTFTRGIADLRNAGLNPILAATRGQTTSPTVSTGPAPSGSGTGGSGTSARASQFRRIDAGLQALNSAAAIGRVEVEIEAQREANKMRKKFGHGTLADKAETISKTATSIKKNVKDKWIAPAGGAFKRVYPIQKQKIKKEWSAIRKAQKRNQAARGPRSNWGLWDKASPYNKRRSY